MSAWTSLAAPANTWTSATGSAAETYAQPSDTAETYTYNETIWDAGASIWDDGTSFWDGAYQNDWGATVDPTIETWWPPGTIEVYFSFGRLTT